jgi:hypothetical protein
MSCLTTRLGLQSCLRLRHQGAHASSSSLSEWLACVDSHLAAEGPSRGGVLRALEEAQQELIAAGDCASANALFQVAAVHVLREVRALKSPSEAVATSRYLHCVCALGSAAAAERCVAMLRVLPPGVFGTHLSLLQLPRDAVACEHARDASSSGGPGVASGSEWQRRRAVDEDDDEERTAMGQFLFDHATCLIGSPRRR